MGLAEEDVRNYTGDTNANRKLVKKGPFYLSGTIIPDPTLQGAKAPQAEAEEEDNEWPSQVKVVYNTEDKDSPPREDGSRPWKRVQSTESTGKRDKEKTKPEPVETPEEEAEPEQEEPEETGEVEESDAPETVEETAERLEQQVEENRGGMEMSNRKIRVYMTSGGFRVRTSFRDVQYQEGKYIVLICHPDDDVTLPMEGQVVEMKTDEMPPTTFRMTPYEFQITGTALEGFILDEVNPEQQENG